MKLRIVFSNNQRIIYNVPVMKYWEYDDEELLNKKMYPLLPLQLFNIRKELEYARKKNDIAKIQYLAREAKEIAEKIAM